MNPPDAAVSATSNPANKGQHGRRLRQRCVANRWFYFLLAPFFLLFFIFGLYPLLFSLYLSFLRWDALSPATWVGLSNFAALAQDELFFVSLKNTLLLGLYHIPPMMLLAFVFAVLLDRQCLKLKGLWRAAVFFPAITPMVVIAIVFSLLFGAELGLVNYLWWRAAAVVGVEAGVLPWLQSESWSKVTVSLLLVWRWTGYNMVIMLAGLQGIDRSLYEAAEVDGATRLQRLTQVTMPLMRPTFLFVFVMSMIGTVYMFDEVFVLTKGGPGVSSTNVGLFLFDEGFGAFRFGYASAAGYSVAAGLFLATLLVLKMGRKDHTA
ncbi:MAG: sugar ABC transporter permease [Planctomycetota bacterium]